MLSRIEPQGTCTCCFGMQKFSQNNEFMLDQKHSYDTNDFVFVCSKKKDLL